MILKVKKIRIIVFNKQYENTLKILQKNNIFMFENENRMFSSEQENTLQKISYYIELLDKNMDKRKMFKYTETEETDFFTSETEALSLIKRIKNSDELYKKSKNKIEEIEVEIESIRPYDSLEIKLSDLKSLQYTHVYIGYMNKQNFHEMGEYVKNFNYDLTLLSESEEKIYFYLPILLINKDDFDILLNEMGFVSHNLKEYDESILDIIKNLESIKNENIAILMASKKEFKYLTTKKEIIEVYHDYLRNKFLRDNAISFKTEETTYITGWIKDADLEKLGLLLEELNSGFEIDEIEIDKNEVTPTAIKNNSFVKPFESITNMFSIPSNKEIDPNPTMSFWYWLIFGIMMGDIGYGILMIVLFSILKKVKNPKGNLKDLINIFILSGFSTIIFGIVFGSFFGYNFDLLNTIGRVFGKNNWSSTLLSPITDPLPVLIVSIGIGLLHLITALVIKTIKEIKQRSYLNAFTQGISWILILIGIATMLLDKNIGVILMITGLALIFFLSGINEKGLLKKIIKGLGGLYGITGYLSDILSYSRILALALSSAVIAFTMNMLAKMVGTSLIGIMFAILIFIIGHTFNFVMGLLSAYVHDSRLQYLEYFGKFFDGEGLMFEPFRYQFKYINKIKGEK